MSKKGSSNIPGESPESVCVVSPGVVTSSLGVFNDCGGGDAAFGLPGSSIRSATGFMAVWMVVSVELARCGRVRDPTSFKRMGRGPCLAISKWDFG
jgi:hypothetical protein